MRKLVALAFSALGLGASASDTAVEMQQRFGPERAFSLMVPAVWAVASTDDRFSANAPNNGPSLNGAAFRIQERPPLRAFADARFEGVTRMGMYKQVGSEHQLSSTGGVVREYEGAWPGEKQLTYYVVACLNAGDIYAAITLVTSKNDYLANRALYEQMLSTFTVYP